MSLQLTVAALVHRSSLPPASRCWLSPLGFSFTHYLGRLISVTVIRFVPFALQRW